MDFFDLNIDIPFKLPRFREKTRVAVTGLSKSGKSVFLTSLIYQLLADDKIEYVHRKSGKKFSVKLMPPESSIARFDYYNFVREFRSKNPTWPKSTKSVTKTTLEINVKSRYDWIENKKIDLELIDYPGEWLLDLDMQGRNFEDWSLNILEISKQNSRKELIKEYLNTISNIDLYNDSDEMEDEKIVEEYKKYLKLCYEKGLSFIQPGRLLQPGDLSNDPILLFAPLPSPQVLAKVGKNSIYARFKNRYERYVKEVVKKLHLDHFQNFDTQVVLIDLLKALEHSKESFEDMRYSIKKILENFTYGKNYFLSKLFGLKIERVIFAATKADLIPKDQIEEYKKLLEDMIYEIKRELDVEHIETDVTVIASVKCAETVYVEIDGKKVACLKGILEGEEEPSVHYPGTLPKSLKDEDLWSREFKFPNFKPPRFPQSNNEAPPHIRMDRIIYDILKDKL
ncbi:MAG: YcjX family protein [Epsilonproteobacteria bacterium]|nr:YcjX family protein [Campylobacterota bacterium]